MAEHPPLAEQTDAAVSTEALRKAESYIEADEGATNRLVGTWGRISTFVAFLSLLVVARMLDQSAVSGT